MDNVASIQTISGTGANHLASLFLAKFPPNPKVNSKPNIFVCVPTWSNHFQIFENSGLNVKTYPYINAEKLTLDIDGILSTIDKEAKEGDIVLLHACAHNPTGIDPTQEQWKQIADLIVKKNLFPFFDCAYQGFASGNLKKDGWAIKHFVERNIDMLVCQSFAKNFGLYGERVGALHVVVHDSNTREAVFSQLEKLQRSEISNPPAYGARIVSRILNSPDLFEEWENDLHTMSNRIIDMRAALKTELEKTTKADWSHIVTQIGMFCYTGLNPDQVKKLREEYHIYMTSNGRVSMAGVNSNNVGYIAQSIAKVL